MKYSAILLIVRNSSSVGFLIFDGCKPLIAFRIVLICLSYKPPRCDASGGPNWHFISDSSILDPIVVVCRSRRSHFFSHQVVGFGKVDPVVRPNKFCMETCGAQESLEHVNE